MNWNSVCCMRFNLIKSVKLFLPHHLQVVVDEPDCFGALYTLPNHPSKIMYISTDVFMNVGKIVTLSRNWPTRFENGEQLYPYIQYNCDLYSHSHNMQQQQHSIHYPHLYTIAISRGDDDPSDTTPAVSQNSNTAVFAGWILFIVLFLSEQDWRIPCEITLWKTRIEFWVLSQDSLCTWKLPISKLYLWLKCFNTKGLFRINVQYYNLQLRRCKKV